MHQIARHELDREFAERQLDGFRDEIEQDLEDLVEFPRGLGVTLSEALMEFRYRCALDPIARYLETWESVTTAMQVGTAIFAAANRSDGSFEYRIAHKLRRIPATGPQYWVDLENWMRAVWLSMICRERNRLRMLANIPLDWLFSTGKTDEFMRPWVAALQTHWRYEQGVLDHLIPAMRATEPAALRVLSADVVSSLFWPVMKAFGFLIAREDAEFNEALTEAVRLHRDFWTRDEERAKDSDGYVALGPLALACLARDYDVPLEVESDYLPKNLVNGEWLGEFPT